jgi:SpoOM protein
MSFFDTVKNWFGIGGVKAVLAIPGQIEKTAGKVAGTVTLTTKSEKLVKNIQVRFEEEWSTGRGEDKTSKTLILGQFDVADAFTIKPGDTKVVNFEVPFSMVKSQNDEMKEKGGVLGGLGKMASMMDAEKSTYSVIAEVDVDKVALDPSDRKNIKLM